MSNNTSVHRIRFQNTESKLDSSIIPSMLSRINIMPISMQMAYDCDGPVLHTHKYSSTHFNLKSNWILNIKQRWPLALPYGLKEKSLLKRKTTPKRPATTTVLPFKKNPFNKASAAQFIRTCEGVLAERDTNL